MASSNVGLNFVEYMKGVGDSAVNMAKESAYGVYDFGQVVSAGAKVAAKEGLAAAGATDMAAGIALDDIEPLSALGKVAAAGGYEALGDTLKNLPANVVGAVTNAASTGDMRALGSAVTDAVFLAEGARAGVAGAAKITQKAGAAMKTVAGSAGKAEPVPPAPMVPPEPKAVRPQEFEPAPPPSATVDATPAQVPEPLEPTPPVKLSGKAKAGAARARAKRLAHANTSNQAGQRCQGSVGTKIRRKRPAQPSPEPSHAKPAPMPKDKAPLAPVDMKPKDAPANMVETPLQFGETDLVYGPSATGKLTALKQAAGGQLLSDALRAWGKDVYSDFGGNWRAASAWALDHQQRIGGMIRFDLTHMDDVPGVVAGTSHQKAITTFELHHLKSNWNKFKNNVVFYQNGKVVQPW